MKCEQQEQVWWEQSEVTCNGNNRGSQTRGEPLLKKVRCQEQTITDEIFDFIGSLDDEHLLAASRIVKVAIKDRQEKRKDAELLATLLIRTQISVSHAEEK